MKRTKFLTFVLLLSVALTERLAAQSPHDAVMMEARQACLLLDYSFSSFDHYWEGTLKRDNQTIATVQRQTILPMVAVGITDKLNIFTGVPYVSTRSTEPNGGKFAGAQGFQDLTVALKYNWLDKQVENGQWKALATLGFSTPITNYLPDYMPYSIGMGAPELSYRAIVQYKLTSGWYARFTGSYLWRGYAKAEREYYYNNGSYYTPWMDVPNAATAEIVVGKWFFDNALQLDLSYLGARSLSGDDIRAYNAAQPTNRVDMDRVGLFAHYFFPTIKGLAVVAQHSRVVHGRNAAEANTTSLGVNYFFHYLKK